MCRLYLPQRHRPLRLQRELAAKSWPVFYRRQFYMPANILIRYPDGLVRMLVKSTERKTARMADDILRCVYRCPQRAITMKRCRFYIFPYGYDLAATIAAGRTQPPYEITKAPWYYRVLRRYLTEDD